MFDMNSIENHISDCQKVRVQCKVCKNEWKRGDEVSHNKQSCLKIRLQRKASHLEKTKRQNQMLRAENTELKMQVNEQKAKEEEMGRDLVGLH